MEKRDLEKAPWIIRITEHKDKTGAVLVIKQCIEGKPVSKGMLHGQPLRRCLPAIRRIVSHVCDYAGIPLELQKFFNRDRITYRGNLPLDEEAGAKLALIFKLQERVADLDRVELMAWRVERFSREEAIYWFTRATQYGKAASRWALAGMRVMLGGPAGDKETQHMLTQIRK
ncbi:hypothetical protein H1164_15095 [Thermoactinomyces daqus]|uniref:DUF7680 domain-containing protein n=1 Tax=Thermoactinomyces daqus TaxID=1329516 RepID=A0A7W1XCN8_9BACL|nr:hypothetical protein [Thermoactinomyces daqus]MBA4544188.1 hypothetical protein [Thermoactinomyces daqus]